MSLHLRLALAAALLVPATSLAEHHEGADGAEAKGGGHGLVTKTGGIAVSLAVNVNLQKEIDAIGVGPAKPISIHPDVTYGVMPKLDVGVYHSYMGLTGFWDQPLGGGGLCVTGEDNGCSKVYNGATGILARYALVEGQLSLAADGGLVLAAFDPDFTVGAKVGVKGMYMAGKIMVMFAPNIYLGFNKRDGADDGMGGVVGGNKEVLNIPVAVGFAASPALHVGVQTGIRGPLDGFGDGYTLPISLGGMFKLNPNMGIFGAFSLNAVANGFGDGGPDPADLRSLSLGFMWNN